MTLGNKEGEGSCITDKNESMMHYIAKVILHKLIRNKGDDSLIEWNTGSKIIDVAQKLSNGKWFCYELQNECIQSKTKSLQDFAKRNPGLIEDVVVIDLSKFKNNTKNMIEDLEKVVI